MPDRTPDSYQQGQSAEIDLLCMAARIVLESGGETYRVEETVRRMAEGLGLTGVNVVAFPTSLFVADGKNAQICRVTRRSTNMKRLAYANDISRRVASRDMDAAQARAALEEVARMPNPPQWLLILMYGLTSASFSLLFGGGPGSFIAAFLIGMAVQVTQPLFSRIEMGTLFANFVGGFITAFGAHALHRLIPYGDINSVIVGGIMPLLTGLLMTTAMRDTMYGDLVSGVARVVEALLLCTSVALGVYVALKFFAVLGGMPV